MPDFIIRLSILVFIFSIATAVILLSRSNNKNVNLKRDLLPTWKPGISSILFFTSNSCTECKTIKKIVLERIRMRNIPIHEINAVSATDLTQYFHVQTVPTTIILDHTGRAIYVNHGFVNEKILSDQLTIVDKYFL